MNWIELDEIDSTSLEVERRLDKGGDIAVFSHVQTAGRGQRGKVWKSPSGNIHLSLGLFRKLDFSSVALVPLQISLILCELIREEFGLSLTIKWPNDLLFAGAKVGGILCESKHVGDQTVLIIGVGINCQVIPEDLPYRVDSLANLLGQVIETELFAQKIAAKIMDHKFFKTYSEFKEKYEYFAIKAGHSYYVDQERLQLKGYSANGTLLLEKNGVETEEFSAASERLWSYQRINEDPVFLADIGNTNIKITSSLSFGKFSETLVIPSHSEISDEHQLKITSCFKNSDAKTMFFSSVKPSFDSTLLSVTPSHLQVQPLRKRFVRLRSSYDLTQLGMDRLLAMEGVLSQDCYRNKTILVMSMGTAITLDAIDEKANHLGGQIIPGIFLQAESLNKHTDLLPLVSEPMGFRDDYGFSTSAAIASGVRDVVLSYIHFHRARLHKLTGKDVTLIVTGGDAAKIAGELEVIEDKELLFKGLTTLVRAGA